jgi:r-opsin
MCGCVWIYSFMWSIPPYLGWGGHMMEGSRTSCTFDYFTRTVNNRSYVISLLIFCFVLQLIVISVAYSRIAMEVFLHQAEIDYSHYECENTTFRLRVASSKKRLNIEWRTAKAVFGLILMFCFSWTPYAIVAVIGQFGNQSSITPLSSAFPGIFAKMSSFMNPVLYTLLHPRYRKLIFPCCIKCREFNYRQSYSSCKGVNAELSDFEGQTRSTSI